MPYKVTVVTDIARLTKQEKFSFQLDDMDKVRDHCKQLMRDGYWRKVDNDNAEWIPPHSIKKVLVSGTGIDKGYSDTDETDD